MIVKKGWPNIERRKGNGRRMRDNLNLCPFHQGKCTEILNNKKAIEKLRDSMNDKLDRKAPRWALILFITTSITLGSIASALVLYGVRESNKEIKSVSSNVAVMQANQNILLEAFHITPVEKAKEVEDESN